MPYAKINEIEIYYEMHGSEDKPYLTLFEGWGTAIWMWFKQLPYFSEHYRVLIFDNRGVGRSTKPDESYTMEMFVEDANTLMKELGIQKTHVLGFSMGGFIAQQFVKTYPDKVQGLVLASTSFGGIRSKAVQPTAENLSKMFAIPTETISKEQSIAMRRSTAFSEYFLKSNKHLFRLMDTWMEEFPQPEYARNRQAEATYDFDSESFLNEIKSPTLVIAGEKDQIVPSQNATNLFETIPNAKLVLIKDAPHRIEVERFEEFNQLVINFLKDVDNGTFKAGSQETL